MYLIVSTCMCLYIMHVGLVTKSCPTLATPWTIACQVPLSMGFSRREYWSGLPFSSPGDLPNPGTESGYPALQADSFVPVCFRWTYTPSRPSLGPPPTCCHSRVMPVGLLGSCPRDGLVPLLVPLSMEQVTRWRVCPLYTGSSWGWRILSFFVPSI